METGSNGIWKWPESSGLDSRTVPVDCDVPLTNAPEMGAPDLSTTVPEKLPVACPYSVGATASAATKAKTRNRILLHIANSPLEWNENARVTTVSTKMYEFTTAHRSRQGPHSSSGRNSC